MERDVRDAVDENLGHASLLKEKPFLSTAARAKALQSTEDESQQRGPFCVGSLTLRLRAGNPAVIGRSAFKQTAGSRSPPPQVYRGRSPDGRAP